MNRWDKDSFEYTDVQKIKQALVGRSIVSTLTEGGELDGVVSFVLDDGSILRAHATDGGCACTNGCFSVTAGVIPSGTITNVEVKEFGHAWGSDKGEIEPGSISDGSSEIRVFVYADLDAQLLLSSEGGDNGYYGWGFWLDVLRPEVAA